MNYYGEFDWSSQFFYRMIRVVTFKNCKYLHKTNCSICSEVIQKVIQILSPQYAAWPSGGGACTVQGGTGGGETGQHPTGEREQPHQAGLWGAEEAAWWWPERGGWHEVATEAGTLVYCQSFKTKKTVYHISVRNWWRCHHWGTFKL